MVPKPARSLSVKLDHFFANHVKSPAVDNASLVGSVGDAGSDASLVLVLLD